MPSFSDSIFLFVLALLLFGPKKLPVLARELGKWVGEFRRASNEFKMQMEEELRASEQTERQKQIAAMEAAAPKPAPLDDAVHPHLADAEALSSEAVLPEASSSAEPQLASVPMTEPLPIASSGNLSIMPPRTGLPTPRNTADPLGGSLLDSIPSVREADSHEPEQSALEDLPEGELHAR